MVTSIGRQAESELAEHLAGSRQELLDLGLRNTLINFRTLKSRGVHVVDERPAEIYRVLVSEGKNMSFEARPDTEGTEGALLQPEDNPTGRLAKRHTDHMLQTNVGSAELQKRLLNSFYWARTSLEEQGVSVLYMALGMLEWSEDDSSSIVRRAPLVLVPVELERSNARDRFHVLYTGEDIGENLSLTEKLASEFSIAAPPFPDSEDFDVLNYFSAWESAISGQPRWRIDCEAVALGFFSFGKFLMYRDLDPTTWPDDNRPEHHPIVSALLSEGFTDAAPTYPDDVFIDQIAGPNEIHQVVDADGSQTLAILEANAGRNLVIQGPPGTGKSQTITNIIAETIAAGKTVLFVSEKMAALEVVKRRLDGVGIGEACLELHSHKTNKRSLLNELQRTLELGSPIVNDLQTEVQLLAEARDRLNAYCTAVNLPVGEAGVTPHRAYGRLLTLRDSAKDMVWPKLEIDGLAAWPPIEFERRASIVEELQARLAAMGRPIDHPLYGVKRTVLLPSDHERIVQSLNMTQQALDELHAASAHLARRLQMSAPENIEQCQQLVAAGQSLIDAPDGIPVGIAAVDWHRRSEEIQELLAAGSRYSSARQQWDDTIIPETWDQDLLELRQDLAAYQGKWWRLISGTFRSARSRLRGLCRIDPPTDLDDQVTMIDEIMDGQRAAKEVGISRDLGRELFGTDWNGENSDWSSLLAETEWAISIHTDVHERRLPVEVLQCFGSPIDVSELTSVTARAREAVSAYDARLRSLLSDIEVDLTRYGWEPDPWETLPLTEQQDLLDKWIGRIEDIDQIVAFNISAKRCREEDLEAVANLASHWELASTHLATAFHISRNEAVIERALTERAALREFDRAGHESVADRFQRLDQILLLHNRSRLALMHWERLPRHQGGGQLATLRREFEKKSRHLPIRQLMERSGNAIQAVKPVFMMSPMSIATYLPPGNVTFDLVIFDEASQVRPADALGALLRGSQAVVVGDSKQLPPTSFFDVLTHGEEISDEDPVTRDIESVLGLFAAQNTLQRMLRWHYRSRHESLITVSNSEFYENGLVVFPSPDAGREHLGLVYHHLPETAYERGGSRANVGEARIVADAVMSHARTNPELTLGVAAFSTAQAQTILDELELRRRNDSLAEAFFNQHEFEPFFVKNLENVQGDERDVIFISIGYGRDANGHLTMNFGPLNNDGGERRLNVLITRARQRCEIFTNLTADDIDLNRTSARGVAALKRYLKYAETGQLEMAAPTGRDMDSPFEEAVYTSLVRAGYRVQPQVGSAGFFIDLAVVDPERPGRYLLGIECDGATYHSARSARDRDRLRQQILEGLGWRIHRIWSTDWFRNPERELRRVVGAIEQARATGHEGGSTPVSGRLELSTDVERQIEPGEPAEVRIAEPYRHAKISLPTRGLELHQIPPQQLASAVIEVVSVESPVHVEEVGRRIVDASELNRLGKRVRGNVLRAIRAAEQQGQIRQRGDFLWRPDMTDPPIRDRSDLNSGPKSVELIAPEEIAAAVLRVVADSYGITRDDVAQAAGRLLGFQRVTANIRAAFDAAIGELLRSDRMVEQGQFLTIVT